MGVMSREQRLFTAAHDRQNILEYPRVLCICSAGMLRSATAAWVLSNDPYNCNTRAAASVTEYGLILVDEFLLEWADEIVFMSREHEKLVRDRFPKYDMTSGASPRTKPTFRLNIDDDFEFRSPELIRIIDRKLHVMEYVPGELTRNRWRN